MATPLHAANPISRDTNRPRAQPARRAARLRTLVWIVVLCAIGVVAGVAHATAKKPHIAAVSAVPRACSEVTRAEVRSTFGGTVGAGKSRTYAGGRSVCTFRLTGTSKIAAADRKPSAGAVTVELLRVSAKSARATLARFDAAEHAKHRVAACTSAWKKSCPVTGFGEAAFFLSRAAGGGGSGRLSILDGTVIIDLSSDLRLAHSRSWAAAPGRRGYEIDQSDLIALGKRIAPHGGGTGSGLTSAQAVFESYSAPTLRLRDTIVVSWATPRRSAVLGAPTGFACYTGPSSARLAYAVSVAAHASLSCVFRHPAPGTYFFKVTVHFARGASGSSHVLEVTVPTIPPAIGTSSVHLTAYTIKPRGERRGTAGSGTTGSTAGSGTGSTAGSGTTGSTSGSGTTASTSGSGTTGSSADSGTYTYQLSWAAPSAPNGDPSSYYSYDIFVTTNTGTGGQSDAPLLIGTSVSTTYTYTVPYQSGAADLVFEVGAVHDGVMGPLTAAS